MLGLIIIHSPLMSSFIHFLSIFFALGSVPSVRRHLPSPGGLSTVHNLFSVTFRLKVPWAKRVGWWAWGTHTSFPTLGPSTPLTVPQGHVGAQSPWLPWWLGPPNQIRCVFKQIDDPFY